MDSTWNTDQKLAIYDSQLPKHFFPSDLLVNLVNITFLDFPFSIPIPALQS